MTEHEQRIDNEYPDEIVEIYYPDWREARIKFMADNPATARALGLTEPPETFAEWVALRDQKSREHIASENCWCHPELDYVDPETGASVYVHRRQQ